MEKHTSGLKSNGTFNIFTSHDFIKLVKMSIIYDVKYIHCVNGKQNHYSA